LAPLLFAGSSNGSATAQVKFHPGKQLRSNLIEQDREMKVSASRTKRAKQHRVSRRQVNQERPPTVASHEAGNGAQQEKGQLEKIILKLVR
jgi:hypothetical protein